MYRADYVDGGLLGCTPATKWLDGASKMEGLIVGMDEGRGESISDLDG